MDIVQNFYDNLASHYDKLFYDWDETVKEQSLILDKLFNEYGCDNESEILDCACGIGTQAIGIAKLGYKVAASDISIAELSEAKIRAEKSNVNIDFENADFRFLSEKFSKKFDVIMAMDNALPHMLTKNDLEKAIESISSQLNSGGIFIASIRDYDLLLETKPPYSPPYIHTYENRRRVSFQVWDWKGDNYKLIQYIIDDNEIVETVKFECEYRALKRKELTDILTSNGFESVDWKFSEQTNFYQPIVIAKKI